MLNPIILLRLNRLGSLGLWGGLLPQESVAKYYNFLVLIASSSIKISVKGDDQGSAWSYALVGVVASILHCDILEGLVLSLSIAILFHLLES